MAYTKRYAGGFVNKPTLTTPIDSTFLNAVETALLALLTVDGTVDGQVLQWVNASTRFGPALLLNKNVDAAAAIDWTKLDTVGKVVNASVAGAAAIARSKLDFGLGLVNADIATAAAIATSKLDIQYGTTLPAAPYDDQLAILVDSITVPTYQWMFRYNSGSSNTDKWEFVGGAPGRGADIDTQQNTTSLTYVALATAGPTFAIPRAGVYDVTTSAWIAQGASNQGAYYSYDIGGTAAVDGDALRTSNGTSINIGHNATKTLRKTLTAVTLTAKYRVTSGGSGDFRDRHMIVTPIRVS